MNRRLKSVLLALLVTFLWSTSWVLIKLGLKDVPALTFAGLRYGLAWLCLLPLALRPANRLRLRGLTRRQWAGLIGLGVLYYAVTQGTQFVGLAYLPAMTVSVLLNFTSLAVALLGISLLNERPTRLQWIGVIVFTLGALIYFYPIDLPRAQLTGAGIVLLGVLANAVSAVLGRAINRGGRLPPLLVTGVSMGVGAGLLLAAGLAFQGLPSLPWTGWAIIAWLAVVNTAFAFTAWNLTLQELSAMQSSLINSTMLIQIALLAWVFLGERLNGQEIVGMILVGLGALGAQLRRG